MIFKKSDNENNEELFAHPHDEIITEELSNKLQAYHDNNQYFEEKFKMDPQFKTPMLGASYIIAGDGKLIYLSGYSHGNYIQSLLDNYAKESPDNRQEVENFTDIYKTIHYVFDGGIRAFVDFSSILILTGFQLPNSKQLQTIQNLPLNEIIFEFELNNGKIVSGIGDFNKLMNTIKKVRQNSPENIKQISLEPTTKPPLPAKQLFPNKYFTEEQLKSISEYPVDTPEYKRYLGGSLSTKILRRAEILDQNKKYISSDNLMNIYKKLSSNFIKIANEYWFTNYSDVIYADGDVGDLNHEMIAEMYLINDNVPVNYECHQKYNHQPMLENVEDCAKNDEDFIEFIKNKYNIKEEEIQSGEFDIRDIDYILWLMTGDDNNVTPEYTELMTALRDPRKYMVDKKGWVRVRGNNIETYSLDPAHLKVIENGLAEVYDDEGMLEDMLFNIEVTSLNKFFENVPFHEIESGDIRKRLRDISDVPKMPLPKPKYYNDWGE